MSKKIEEKANKDKMGDILTNASAKPPFFGPQYGQTGSATKRLEFSHRTICNYKQHSKQAMGLIQNHNTKCITTYNDKDIHMWDPLTLERYFNKTFVSDKELIKCMCYSKKWHLYFACTTNFKLLILNEFLNIMKEIPLEIGLVQSMHFIDESCQLITAGVYGAYLIDMIVKYKYEPKTAITLDPKGTSLKVAIKIREDAFSQAPAPKKDLPTEQFSFAAIRGPKEQNGKDNEKDKNPNRNLLPGEEGTQVNVPASKTNAQCIFKLEGNPRWSAGVLSSYNKRLIVQWNKKDVFFYNFQPSRKSDENAKDMRVYTAKCSQEDYITSVNLYEPLNYLIVGKQFGNISVFKYTEFPQPKAQLSGSRPERVDSLLSGGTAMQRIGSPQKSPIGKKGKKYDHVQPRIDSNMHNCSPVPGSKPTADMGSNENVEVSEHQIGKQKSIHTFKGHTRKVTDIRAVRSKFQNTFVSASLDGTVRIWCLDKLIELYVFNVLQGCSEKLANVELLNAYTYALFFSGQNNAVEIGQISHLANSYHISRANIKQVNKAFSGNYREYTNDPKSLIVSFDNNSTYLLNPSDGMTKSTIYPPPSSTKIRRTMFCMSLRRVIVMLENGAFCVYRVHKRSTGKLDMMQYSRMIKCQENKSLTQEVTCMIIGTIKPPQEDEEIFAKGRNADQMFSKEPRIDDDDGDSCSRGSLSEYSDEEQTQIPVKRGKPEDHFLILGLSKGSIVFIRVDEMGKIYARFRMHKQAVEHVYEIKSKQRFVSICCEYLNVWGFQPGQKVPHVYQSFDLKIRILDMKVLDDNLFVLFPSGETRLFRYSDKMVDQPDKAEQDEEGLVYKPPILSNEAIGEEKSPAAQLTAYFEHMRRKDIGDSDEEEEKKIKQIEHEAVVLSIDVHLRLGICATGDREGLIKIWTKKKEIVREIKFTEPITALCFLNKEADLLIGHGCNLSRVYARDYIPKGGFQCEDYEEFMEEQIPVTNKVFEELYQNFVKLRKQDEKQFEIISEGVPIKKELPPDDFNEAECTNAQAEMITKELNRAKRPKTQGRPSVATNQQKNGQAKKGELTEDQLAQVFSIGLQEANIEQAKRQSQHNKIQKRNNVKSEAHKKDESTHEVVSDAVAMKAEARAYLNTMKAGKITALPKSLLKNMAQEKKQQKMRIQRRKPMTRQQMTRERITCELEAQMVRGPLDTTASSYQMYGDLEMIGQQASTHVSTQRDIRTKRTSLEPINKPVNHLDFQVQMQSGDLENMQYRNLERFDKPTIDSDEQHSGVYKYSAANLMQPAVQIQEKQPQSTKYTNAKSQFLGSKTHFFSNITIEGGSQGQNNKNGGQQAIERVTREHPISAHGVPRVVKPNDPNVKQSIDIRSSDGPNVLSIDTGVSSSAHKTGIGARTLSSGGIRQNNTYRRPATMGGGMRMTHTQEHQGIYGTKLQSQGQRNVVQQRQAMYKNSYPISQIIHKNANRQGNDSRVLVELPNIVDSQESETVRAGIKGSQVIDLKQNQHINGGFTRNYPEIMAPHQKLPPHTAHPGTRQKKGKGIHYGLANSKKMVGKPSAGKEGILATSTSYQRKADVSPRKLGSANSSDLNFMLGPKQVTGNSSGLHRSSNGQASSVFQSGATFKPQQILDNASQMNSQPQLRGPKQR